jgi:hypothetical protein
MSATARRTFVMSQPWSEHQLILVAHALRPTKRYFALDWQHTYHF